MENVIVNADCIEGMKLLSDDSVNMVFTSPPYASQRKKHYNSIGEKDYPQWTVRWMEVLRPKLKEDGSIFIVIRPHLQKGQLSDYVLRTRIALRESNWTECEELIWLKNDAPPLGSLHRPRRVYESILWFSKTGKPYVNLKACGSDTKRIGFAGSDRFGFGGSSPIASSQKIELSSGTSRCTDVIRSNIGEIAHGIMHPAMFPQTLSNQMIMTYSRENDLIVDPFAGSGTTCLSAAEFNRRWIGFDMSSEYVDIATNRLLKYKTLQECRVCTN